MIDTYNLLVIGDANPDVVLSGVPAGEPIAVPGLAAVTAALPTLAEARREMSSV